MLDFGDKEALQIICFRAPFSRFDRIGTIRSKREGLYVHPFREGNGRTQMAYLAQLARRAGHLIDLSEVSKTQWLTASRTTHLGRYDDIERCILDALMKSR